MKRSPMPARTTRLRAKTSLRRTGRLQSRTGLRRGAPLERKAPLRASKTAPKPARQKAGVPTVTRAAVRKRSGRLCEIRRVGCQQWAMQVHHRITQKAGGRHGEAKAAHDRLSNVLDVCFCCHDWVGLNPIAARSAGWSLEEWQIPSQEPVLYRGEPRYLTDDGRVLDFEEVGA